MHNVVTPRLGRRYIGKPPNRKRQPNIAAYCPYRADSQSGVVFADHSAPWDLIENRAAEAQAEREEADRLAYVAATRARDLLVVTAIGTQEWDGWTSPLNAALYPTTSSWRNSRADEWCDFGGQEPALDWDDSSRELIPVNPGLHTARAGGHEVLWLNPGLLEMDKDVTAGIANKEILQGDPAPGLALYDEWKSRRAAILEKGRIPTFRIVVATDAATTVETQVPIETVSIVVNVSRARGRRFGSLVHAVIMDADLDCDSVMLQRLARAHGFRLDSSESEISSAVEVVDAMLKHPILKASAQAAIAHREYPFLYKDDDGTITEGNIDLVYRLANEWIIVDFKTGPSDRKEHRKQVDMYARAFRPTSVRAVLFEVI